MSIGGATPAGYPYLSIDQRRGATMSTGDGTSVATIRESQEVKGHMSGSGTEKECTA